MNELFERIADDKRNRILKAAITEFARCGYDTANTNEIAKNAGISVGSLYKYFTSKEDLFLTTVKSCAEVLRATLEEIMRDEEDILIKLEKILRMIQKHSRENIKMIQLYNEMSTQSNSKLVLESVEEIESMTAELYSSLIKKAQREHKTRDDCDPRLFAFFLDNLFMMLQFSYSCDYYRERFKIYVSDDIFEKDDYVVEEMLKFIKAAFSPKE